MDKEHNSQKDLDNLTKKLETSNERLERIYRDLCEFEDILNQQNGNEEPVKLLEILELINSVQSTASELRPLNERLENKEKTLDGQVKVLEKAIELLNLQTNKNA